MATFSRQKLSGSTNGKPIPVAGTNTGTATTIHQATSGTGGSNDEIDLWASNVTGSAATLTVEWGGTTSPGDHLCKDMSIPANSTVRIAEGQILENSLNIKAFSGTASAINITGRVLRIS